MTSQVGLWKTVGRILRNASVPTKVSVGLTPVLLIVLTAAVVADLVGSDRPTARIQVWSLILGNAGLLMWSLAAVLHATSRATPPREAASEANALFRRIWHRWLRFTARGSTVHGQPLHDIVVVLPILGVVAGCLLAAATGILLPSVPQSPLLGVPIVLYGFFVVMAVRTVYDAVQFLYGYAREQAEAAADAQSHATAAQLAALQAQLNPHFLFNALNTVAALVKSHPDAAERTVDNLAHVLRRTVVRSRHPLSTVDDEIDYLRAYLSVEKERFGDRLCITWHVDPRSGPRKIPAMTLQPLVENALKHGIGARLQGGTLTIGTRLTGDEIVLTVTDDGAGFPRDHTEGTGLRNLRERLTALYQDPSLLRVDPVPGEGARVTVRIPHPPPKGV